MSLLEYLYQGFYLVRDICCSELLIIAALVLLDLAKAVDCSDCFFAFFT